MKLGYFVIALTVTLTVGVANTLLAQTSFTVLASFTGDNGAYPSAGVIQTSDGSFYGTTQSGGAYGYGTIFKRDPAGALTTVHSFTGDSDGSYPSGNLLLASDGHIYGMTSGIRPGEHGTVFRLQLPGTLTTLHRFNGSDGSDPRAALIQGADGMFYGPTLAGGAHGAGTVFRINSAGVLSTLHSFDPLAGEAGYPLSTLVQGPDGNYYGSTIGEYGTIFRISPTGNFDTIHTFAATGGYSPRTALIVGTDNALYGTTWGGACGSIFRITTAGTLSTLYSFNCAPGEGVAPISGLVADASGNLFGGTQDGGEFFRGTIFKLDTTGSLTTVHHFDGVNGGFPSGLMRGNDGALYGTSLYDADGLGFGNLFRLGNQASYVFSGFFRPVDNLPTINVLKAGSAVPLKFSLGGDRGLAIMQTGSPGSYVIGCDGSALTSTVEETVSAGASGLSYDQGADMYTYVWKTDKSWSSTCRRFVLTLSDGSSHSVNFKFEK